MGQIELCDIKELLKYDPDTGEFFWLQNRGGKAYNGHVAGGKNNKGYIKIQVKNKFYSAHRLAWFFHYGSWPKGCIDHINGIRNDNRIENLRDVSASENLQNTRTRKDNTSGYKGVYWHKRQSQWMSRLRIKNKTIFLGYFDDKESAFEAYKIAAAKYHTCNPLT